MIERRSPVYTDENVNDRVVGMLRARGFDIVAARDVGMLGRPDTAQLAYAASAGRVFLTFDRGDFRRLHREYLAEGHQHAGVALLPQRGPLERLAVRASMLLDWLTLVGPTTGPSPLVNWNDLQIQLHRGARVPGCAEVGVRVAPGLRR